MTTSEKIRKIIPLMKEWGQHAAVDLCEEAASEIEALQKELEESKRSAKFWEDEAARFCRNEFFYRDLIVKIGEPFGVAARTSDDGSIQQDVLALKVPELVDSLRSTVAELEKDNAALHDRCICAFCKQEFSKRDLAAVADHLTNCEQSPLVKRGKELFEMCNTFEAKIAELEAEANKEHAKAVELCDKLIESRRRVAELEKDKERLLKAFRHTHRNNSQNDNCAFCGLDLRDEIHIRIAAMSAEKK